jgi:hypothetical protein
MAMVMARSGLIPLPVCAVEWKCIILLTGDDSRTIRSEPKSFVAKLVGCGLS